MRLVGLTGGIASGKSTVSRRLESQGLPIIDPDKVAQVQFLSQCIAYPISEVREVSGSCARMSCGWNCIRSGAMKEMIL